jgi:hypothetical protein
MCIPFLFILSLSFNGDFNRFFLENTASPSFIWAQRARRSGSPVARRPLKELEIVPRAVHHPAIHYPKFRPRFPGSRPTADPPRTYSMWTTLSDYYAKMGNKPEAIKAVDKAVEFADAQNKRAILRRFRHLLSTH